MKTLKIRVSSEPSREFQKVVLEVETTIDYEQTKDAQEKVANFQKFCNDMALSSLKELVKEVKK